MLQKLCHYGIRGSALNWFSSYLSDRKQFVTYNDVSSSTKVISCGVPQGSILGPLLFLIYINDLCNICKLTTPILFADDTNLFSSGTDLDIMECIINEELTHISEWLKVNKLSLNIKKTQYMVFTKKKRKSPIKLKIDGHAIHEVCKTKFLGVFIDNKLNWKDHISYISSKIARGLGMIIKARNYLNKNGLVNLYYSFIYPYLTYCNHIWGSTYKTNLQKLVILQNKVVRIISHVKSRISAAPLYDQLRIMQFLDINKYLIGRFMYKYHTGNVPTIFVSFFQQNREIHDYNTRTASHLHIPAVKSDLGKTGIRYRGALIWNYIYNDGYNTDVSEAVFVKCLKTIIKNKIIPWISQSISLTMNVAYDLFFFPADVKVYSTDISDCDSLVVCVYIICVSLFGDHIARCATLSLCIWTLLCNRFGAHKPSWASRSLCHTFTTEYPVRYLYQLHVFFHLSYCL